MKKYGVHKEEFKHELFTDEFGYNRYTKWCKLLHQRCRPVHLEYFITDLDSTLENLIKKGYIVENHKPEGVFIKEDGEKSRQLLAWYYYPKVVLEWKPIQNIIANILKT